MKASIRKYAKALVSSLNDEKDAAKQKERIDNFLAILRKRKQSKFLKRFEPLFKDLWLDAKGELAVKIVLPYEPTEEEEKHLGKLLSEVFGKKVLLNVAVNEKVIGGMRMEFGEHVIDGTILKNLEMLKAKIAYNN